MGDDDPEVRWVRRWRRLFWRRFKGWIQALRVHFLSASMLPVLLGLFVARKAGPVNGWRLLLVLAGVFFYHSGADLINDLYDEEADRLNRQPSLFNGGSRVLVNKIITAAQLKKAVALCYTLGSVCAFVLALTGGGVGVLLFALAGLGCGYFYSAPPVRLAATGLGELCVGLAFGPFLVLGTTAALAGRFLPNALLVSLPVGVLIAAVVLINELPDLESDRQAGKRTLAVRLGRAQSIRLLVVLLVIASSLLYLSFLRLGARRYGAGSILTLPLGFWLWSQRHGGLKEAPRFMLASTAMILLHTACGLMLIFTLVKGGN